MATQHYNQVIVSCTDLNKTVKADVLHRTSDMIKVAFVGSTTTMTLHRKDPKRPYVGNYMKMEFMTTGEEV